MRLFNNIIVLLVLVLIISSCSVHNMVGIYSYKRGTPRDYVTKALELKKDSTFECTEDYHREPEEDVGAPVYRYVGQGHYTINNKKLTLNFDSKFRRIYKIDIIQLTPDEITEIRKNNSYIDQTLSGNYLLNFNIYLNNYSFQHANSDASIGAVKISERWFSRMSNNYIVYSASDFPSSLTFDFEKFSARSISGYLADLYPEDINTLDFNFGFFDEKVRIGKPGNYKINIYPFVEDYSSETTSQTFTGKRVFPISNVLGTAKIGDMIRR